MLEEVHGSAFKGAITDMAFPEDPEGGLQICQYLQKHKIPT